MPEIRYPTPDEAAAALSQIPLERLATPADLALALVPQQRRRRVVLPPVVRLGRRAGRLR